MGTPRAVARDLRRTATQVARIADTSVTEAAELGVELGASAGGRLGRRGRPMVVIVRDVSNARGRSAATIAGKTAGAWALKSYGRSGGYTVRPTQRNRRRALDLRSAGLRRSAAASVRPGSTSGDDRWSRLVASEVIDAFPDIAGDQLSEAIDD